MSATLFVNGRFLVPGRHGPDPTWLLARDGRIEAMGREVPPHAPGTEEIDLQGGTAIPGPVDAHCHLVTYGMIRRREADLRGAGSLAEIGRRLREHAGSLGLHPDDGRWLLGRGFEQDLLAERRWPTREDLDRIAPDRPLRISRVCGHALVANTAALRQAGLDPSTRRGDFPSGVLTENAQRPIYDAIPAPASSEWLDAARWACHAAAAAGFVGVHSLMANADEIRALVDLRREGPLPIRVRMQLPYPLLREAGATGLRTGFGDDWLRIGAVKLFSDGSLGARTAALMEPYSDDPSTSGELIYPPEELARRVESVYAAGFQVCVHAIGDRAMQVTLDGIEQAAVAHPNPFPPRIEHASMVNALIIERMRVLGVGAAVQPQFARSDYWSPERLGAVRVKGCYAFRTLSAAGVPLAGSTDCPVERLDALAAIGQMAHRPEWSPGEALPLEDVLRIFSEGSYRIDGDPTGSGRLQPGRTADFIVLEQDPRVVPPTEIEGIRLTMAVVHGCPSYQAGRSKGSIL